MNRPPFVKTNEDKIRRDVKSSIAVSTKIPCVIRRDPFLEEMERAMCVCVCEGER